MQKLDESTKENILFVPTTKNILKNCIQKESILVIFRIFTYFC